ncbi:MAG TPA: hypothetical protein VN704_03740 [Verrucomicrobiae bacterium]|nr:hypothetical protein [Verrucomicrobiae bacterium]
MLKNGDTSTNEKQTVVSIIRVPKASKLIDFLKQVFDATEFDGFTLLNWPFSKVKIGESIILISDSTTELEPTIGAFYIHVENVDKIYKKALECGAIVFKDPKNNKGNKIAIVKDMFENQWWITEKTKTYTEDFEEDAKEMDESQSFSI